MKLTPREKSILALLKLNQRMKYKDIKSFFEISTGSMNTLSFRLRTNKLVVSISRGREKLWLDKDYAKRLGIKPDETKHDKKGGPYKEDVPAVNRGVFINSLWRIAV